MDLAILDTDILSDVVKRKHPQVTAAAKQYLDEHPRLAFSDMTTYEIIRGLLADNASRKLSEFFNVVGTSDTFPITMRILMRAADLWAEGETRGLPHNDADLIIAATAIEEQRVLVTGNTDHFSWIPGLRLENWRTLSL